MKQCIFKVYAGFCLLLKECKCSKNSIIHDCNPFKYSLDI
jgi:hypothetical protein